MRRSIGFGSVSAIISGHQYAGDEVAGSRGQTLAEMALAWVLKDDLVTSVIVGASSVKQLEDNLKVTENCKFSTDEIQRIGNILQ